MRRSLLVFLLLLYAACFILYYGLVAAFYLMLAGPGTQANCTTQPANKICASVAAIGDKFTTPWFYGGIVVSIVGVALFIRRRRSQRG